MKLYSYTIVSDNGYAPNPTGGVCTLAYCMSTMRKTVQIGDYVVGLAGASYRQRVGAQYPGYPIIYAMRGTDVIDSRNRFQGIAAQPALPWALQLRPKCHRAAIQNKPRANQRRFYLLERRRPAAAKPLTRTYQRERAGA